MNIGNYEINKNALCIIKKGQDHNLFMDIEPFDSNHTEKLGAFLEIFCLEDTDVLFDLDTLGKLKGYLVNNEDFKVFDKIKVFKYCEDIASPYQGFEVHIQSEVEHIDNEVTQISRILEHQTNLVEALDRQAYLIKMESDLVRNVIQSYYCKIKLWFDAYVIRCAYKKCISNPDVLYHSHRILGWSKPEMNLHEDLSVEFKTNFGFGHSSYFFLKIKYQGFDIVSFVDAVKYPYWEKNENVFYTRKYDLLKADESNESNDNQSLHLYWVDAFEHCCKIVNILNKSRAQFVEEVILDALTSLIKYLDTLEVVNKGIEKQCLPVISLHDKSDKKKHINGIEKLDTDLSVIEVSNPELAELFQLCNAFNFIPLIEIYSKIVSKKDTVDELYRLAKSAEPNIPAIISNVENKIELLSLAMKATINSLSVMKDQHEKYEVELKNQPDAVHITQFTESLDYKVFYVKRNSLFEKLHGYEENMNVQKNDLSRCKKLFNELQEMIKNK